MKNKARSPGSRLFLALTWEKRGIKEIYVNSNLISVIDERFLTQVNAQNPGVNLGHQAAPVFLLPSLLVAISG